MGMVRLLLADGLAPARYECTVTLGPPVQVQVHRGRRPVGPTLRYDRPGKMASAADVDGDGRLDLLVLVYKTTRYHPNLAWRPFLYTLREGEWVPKWLGSRVGHPLEEAALVHTPEGVRLLTIEQFTPGQNGLTLYHWCGFGFWGEWTGPAVPALSDLVVTDEDKDGVDEVSVVDDGMRRRYAYRDGGYYPVRERDRGEVR